MTRRPLPAADYTFCASNRQTIRTAQWQLYMFQEIRCFIEVDPSRWSRGHSAPLCGALEFLHFSLVWPGSPSTNL